MKSTQTILINKIDLSDDTFSTNFRPDLQVLRSSIKEIGMIQPVLLKKKGGRYQIISGYRRIMVLNELGIKEVASKLFEEGERDDLQLFSLALHENMTTRGLNPVEKAIALYKLVHLFKVEPPWVIQTYLPLLRLEPNEKILNTYLSLARMEDEVKEYVLREEVSRSNIRKLAGLMPEDRSVLIPFLSSLKLGENRLREILSLLDEISRRDGLKIEEIIKRPELQAILSQKELTTSQKTERIKKVLINFRYPRMHQLEEEFERKRRNLHLPPQLSIHHQPFFEGKGLSIEFHFESLEEYRDILSFLSQLADEKEFEEIIKND